MNLEPTEAAAEACSGNRADTAELYRDLVETSQDLIWQCDAEGRYIFLNSAWEEVFGYSLDEMVGRKYTDFQSPEFAKRDQLEFVKMLKSGIVKGFETTHLGKTGNEIHLVFNAKIVTDKNGYPCGTRGTAYDNTDRKRYEQTLEARLRLLEFAKSHTIHELLQATLDEAELLTSSQIGFYHFVDPDENNLTLKAWSTNTILNMCTAEGQDSHYPIDLAGVWVDCVR